LLFIYGVHKNIPKNVNLCLCTEITRTGQPLQVADAAAASLSDQDTTGTAHLFYTSFRDLCRFLVHAENVKTNVHYYPA